jgi:hypothetical protein
MEINALTDSPQSLINAINKAINDKSLKTWEVKKNDKGEILYSHSPEQWSEKAMLKPIIHANKVQFIMAWWTSSSTPGDDVKGYILGRFTEILVVHFKEHFSKLETLA